MQAMIQNDEEKEWMYPLLELRNELDVPDDKPLRDFRRMNGLVQLFNKKPIHGPYTQSARERWLHRVLEAQHWVRLNGPEHVRDMELITLGELQEIRRIWVIEKHETEDSLPTIYKNVTGQLYPGAPIDDTPMFGAEEMKLLREACGGDNVQFELARELLDVERRHRSMVRRAGLFSALENALKRGYYTDAKDAEDFALSRHEAMEEVQRVQAGKLVQDIPTQLAMFDPGGVGKSAE